MPANLIGIFGVITILAIAVAFSSNRKAIHLRVVGAAFVLQAGLAAIVLYSPWGQRVITGMSKGVLAVIGFSRAGIDMVFGPLADTDIIGFRFSSRRSCRCCTTWASCKYW
jgi:CNT family concentrative nucleoside transporter